MIRIQNLTKHAVDGISFSGERCEVLGFLGPKGAGKFEGTENRDGQ